MAVRYSRYGLRSADAAEEARTEGVSADFEQRIAECLQVTRVTLTLALQSEP